MVQLIFQLMSFFRNQTKSITIFIKYIELYLEVETSSQMSLFEFLKDQFYGMKSWGPVLKVCKALENCGRNSAVMNVT